MSKINTPLRLLRQPSLALWKGVEKHDMVQSHELLKKSRVLLFGGPGAFVQPFGDTHLLDFAQNYNRLKEVLNIDKLICLVPNDPFVSEKWKESVLQGFAPEETPLVVSDPDLSFIEQLGMARDYPVLGRRSERFVFLVDDGQVLEFRVEPSPIEYKLTSPQCLIDDHISKQK